MTRRGEWNPPRWVGPLVFGYDPQDAPDSPDEPDEREIPNDPDLTWEQR